MRSKKKKITEKVYEIQMLEPLLGTVPSSMNLCKLLKIGTSVDERVKLERMFEEQGEEEGGKNTVFFRDEHGIYLANYQFKGFLKEAAKTLKKEIGIPA